MTSEQDSSHFQDQPANNLSRKERREVRRQGQRQGHDAQQRSRFLRRLSVWGVGILLIGGLGWGVIQLADTVQLPASNGELAIPVTETDHVRGPADAKVTLVEYSDFQCPACAAFEPWVRQLFNEPELKNTLRLVYRHFPLAQIHPNAQLAAQASEAAALQGKFWEMHGKMFDTQVRWSAMSNKGARDTFSGYAQELGLNTEQFSKDLELRSVRDRIATDYSGGLRSGVDATPTFFVNGIRMQQPQSYDQFKRYIINGIQPTP